MNEYHKERIKKIQRFLEENNSIIVKPMAEEFLKFLAPSLEILIEPKLSAVYRDTTEKKFGSIYFDFMLRNDQEVNIRFFRWLQGPTPCVDLWDSANKNNSIMIENPTEENYKEIIKYLENHCLMIIH